MLCDQSVMPDVSSIAVTYALPLPTGSWTRPSGIARVFFTVITDTEFLTAASATLWAVVQGLFISLIAGTAVERISAEFVEMPGLRLTVQQAARLWALDPESGKALRSIDVTADAGTAFDGRHLYQIGGGRIRKIDPKTGHVLATIPAPGDGGHSGLAWAEGTLWVGQHRARKIHQIDPETGAILRTIESNRFVTGVTWVDGELWHGTWENDESDVRRIDPRTGEVLEKLEMPAGVAVSGLESDGGDRFFCGGGNSGKVRAVRRTKRESAATGRQGSRLADQPKKAAKAWAPKPR